jgi:hypothetical protein
MHQQDYEGKERKEQSCIKLWPAVEQSMGTEWQRRVYETARAAGCSSDATTATNKPLCLWASMPKGMHSSVDTPMPGAEVKLHVTGDSSASATFVKARILDSSFMGSENEPKTGLFVMHIVRN